MPSQFDVTSDDREDLIDVLSIAFRECTKVTECYEIEHRATGQVLIFRWHAPETRKHTEKFIASLEEMEQDTCLAIIRAWLRKVDYGPEPDTNGSIKRGWRFFNEAWGHVFKDHYAAFGVLPVWIVYGK